MWIFVIFFLLFHHGVPEYQRYFCAMDMPDYTHVTDVQLKPNDVTFIETLNFTSLEDNFIQQKICNMTFHIEPSSLNKTVVLVITNPLLLDFWHVTDNQDDITWFWDSNNNGFFYMQMRIFDFQGFIIHDELDSIECFLESVSSPYHFNDETQILYIRSSITKVNVRKNPCNWYFTAPDGYGFKIVVAEYNALPDVTLAATNSSNFYIVNQHSVIINKPYYNEDQNLFVFLSNSNQSFALGYEFGAYITVVKKEAEIVDGNCYFSDDETWSNTDYYDTHGYANNAYCSYVLEIYPNTIVVAQRHDEYIIESADTVSYFDEFSDRWIIFGNDKNKTTFFPYRNQSIREMRWEFKSDGSVRGGGFNMELATIYCFCNSPIWSVYCDDGLYTFSITNTTYRNEYCSNMKCNFTVQMDSSCKNHLIKFTIVTTPYPSKLHDLYDSFRLITNEETMLYISSSNFSDAIIDIVLNPNSTHIFEAITTDTELLIPRTLYVILQAIKAPKLRKTTILTKQKPFYFLDVFALSEVDIVGIEVDDTLENEFIEVYVNLDNSQEIFFYNDEALTHFVKTDECFLGHSFKCKIKTKKLFVWFLPIDDYLYSLPYYIFILFQIESREFNGNCLFHTDAFLNTFRNPISFSNIAGPNGTCKAFLLNSFDSIPFLANSMLNNPFNMNKVWTTAIKENVKVYVASENDISLIFEFNQNTSDEWQRIVMNSPVYMFEIPTNSSLFISTDLMNPSVQTEIKPYEYRTIIQSPHYIYLYNKHCYAEFTINEDTFVTFNVIYFEAPSVLSYLFYESDKLRKVDKVGTTFTLTNVSISMCYLAEESDQHSNKTFGIIYELNIKMENDSATTTSTTIRSSPTTSSTTTTAFPTTTETSVASKTNIICNLLYAVLLKYFFCVDI